MLMWSGSTEVESWTNENLGMRFWRWPRTRATDKRDRGWDREGSGRGREGCTFFEWEDLFIRGRAMDVINGLKERERRLHREIQILRMKLEHNLQNHCSL